MAPTLLFVLGSLPVHSLLPMSPSPPPLPPKPGNVGRRGSDSTVETRDPTACGDCVSPTLLSWTGWSVADSSPPLPPPSPPTNDCRRGSDSTVETRAPSARGDPVSPRLLFLKGSSPVHSFSPPIVCKRDADTRSPGVCKLSHNILCMRGAVDDGGLITYYCVCSCRCEVVMPPSPKTKGTEGLEHPADHDLL